MGTWNPDQYLKFSGPRLRPGLDLLSRVAHEGPRTVYDLGCGTGDLTVSIAERWPHATVRGVDGSSDMLEKARSRYPSLDWLEADLAAWNPDQPADLIYSNACLHWLDDHAELFPKLAGHLNPGGVLAVQMPCNHGAPTHTCMAETALEGPWTERLKPLLREAPVAEPAVYYDILSPVVADLDVWETIYMHVLDGDNPVAEWTRGSALKPLLDALNGKQREIFFADYSRRVQAAYPVRADGKTLMPFRRLFMIARMGGSIA